MKLTTLGLSNLLQVLLQDSWIVQKNKHLMQTIQQFNMDSSDQLNMNIMYCFEPFGEYLGTASKVSSDKFMQDGYYYQDLFTKFARKYLQKKLNLLLDELSCRFIHFIQNRFQSELAHRITTMELPEVEVENSVYVDTEAVFY